MTWTLLALTLLASLNAEANELIAIETIRYARNEQASYCRVRPENFDTIVFHHTETPVTTSPTWINELHLNRGTPDDPWWMIGYHFTINGSYPNRKNVPLKVTRGRELEFAGSHAGSLAFSDVSKETAQLLAENDSVLCGPKNGPLAIPEDKFDALGRVKTNFHTIAVAIIGNYVARSRENPGGYAPGSPRFPSQEMVEASARLACQLQRSYPRVKTIRYHAYYRATLCPGLIEKRLQQIRNKAKEFGCDFN